MLEISCGLLFGYVPAVRLDLLAKRADASVCDGRGIERVDAFPRGDTGMCGLTSVHDPEGLVGQRPDDSACSGLTAARVKHHARLNSVIWARQH